MDQTPAEKEFDSMAARLIHREALRRAAADLNTTSPLGLENALARISAEVTEEAAERAVDAHAQNSAQSPHLD